MEGLKQNRSFEEKKPGEKLKICVNITKSFFNKFTSNFLI